MAYIKEYWTNKQERASQARKHTLKMEEKYKNEIAKSIKNTICYSTDYKSSDSTVNKKDLQIEVIDIDSVSAILQYKKETQNRKIAVLNFSSYKNPGGMFLSGSKAQEECLCHESFLYNVLSQKQKFYEWNNWHKNKALYLNRALYSPDIRFEKNDSFSCLCDVITCAAPNKSAAQKYQDVSDEENTKALHSRIKFILDIAKDNQVDTLILGAYGCGVFGQSAHEVASIFKEYLDTTHSCFEKVVFAIPKGNNNNYIEFKKVFGGINNVDSN